jgi:hypothetical protein
MHTHEHTDTHIHTHTHAHTLKSMHACTRTRIGLRQFAASLARLPQLSEINFNVVKYLVGYLVFKPRWKNFVTLLRNKRCHVCPPASPGGTKQQGDLRLLVAIAVSQFHMKWFCLTVRAPALVPAQFYHHQLLETPTELSSVNWDQSNDKHIEQSSS